MADSAETETTETEGTEGTESTESTEEKSVPQSEVDRIVESRLARERKKFADYDQLKERAAKLDEIEQAQLTELERERKAREDAEARANAASESLRQTSFVRRLSRQQQKPASRTSGSSSSPWIRRG